MVCEFSNIVCLGKMSLHIDADGLRSIVDAAYGKVEQVMTNLKGLQWTNTERQSLTDNASKTWWPSNVCCKRVRRTTSEYICRCRRLCRSGHCRRCVNRRERCKCNVNQYRSRVERGGAPGVANMSVD